MARKLSFTPLLLTIFFCVSGGPIGLEEAVSQAGPGLAILLILAVPVVWAVPAALMTAELSSMMPVEGGYVVWVREALGPFAGFLCGWWTWTYSWVDVAIYPVLFASLVTEALREQLGSTYLEQHPWAQWGVAVAMIIPFVWINVRGISLAGRTSVILMALLVAPFLVMSVTGLFRLIGHSGPVASPLYPPSQTFLASLGGGLFIVMWNYLGWDSMSTVAGEVEDPRRSYPKALLWGVPIVVAIYLLPVIAGLVATPDWTQWREGSWPTLAGAVGGKALMWAVFGASLVSSAGLFNGTLLASSRIPFVLGREGFLPPQFTRVNPTTGAPTAAILVCSAIYALFAMKSFAELVIVDVMLYAAGLILELAALAVLRVKRPDAERPYRIPGGWPALAAVILAPTAIVIAGAFASLAEDGSRAFLMAFGALLLGPVAYWILGGLGRKLNWGNPS